MRILSFIEDQEVTHPSRLSSRWRAGQKDLEALRNLVNQKPSARGNAPPVDIRLDYSPRGVGPHGPEADSQIPPSEEQLYKNPDYPLEISSS